MEEIRTNQQLIRTSIDCLTLVRAQITSNPEKDDKRTWIWNDEEIKALDVVLSALKDCIDPTL